MINFPLPLAGERARSSRKRGGWGTLRESVSSFVLRQPRLISDAVVRGGTPTPTLPRKRERGRTERAAGFPNLTSAPQSDCLWRNQNLPGKQRHVLCAGHRSGHHVLARHRVPQRHFHRRHGAAEFPQHFPASGWVEHEPEDIWTSTVAVCREALEKAGLKAKDIAAIGITNQRETTVVWDRATGQAVHRAIVWQDRRTCRHLRQTEERRPRA